jgi:DNA-binding transcriptional regulator YdaS (Cro superfamily)
MADWKEHLARAIRILGSQPKLAAAMGCSQSKVSWLLVTAKDISAEDSLAIDHATGGEVAKWQLRPDLWEANKAALRQTSPSALLPEPERAA